MESYEKIKKVLALGFMNYLDENRPEGKMSLSNGECEDIDKAFKENDWAKIMRYVEKYSTSWKPSEIQMYALKVALETFRVRNSDNISAGNDKVFTQIESLYEQLKKLLS